MNDKSNIPRQRVTLPLSFTMPLLLIACVAAVTWWSYHVGKTNALTRVRTEAIHDLTWTASRLDSMFERALRLNDDRTVQEEVSALGSNREFVVAVVTDETYAVLHSMRAADIGKQLEQVLPAPYIDTPVLQRVSLDGIREREGVMVEATGDGHAVIAAHPLVLSSRASELIPNRIGTLVLIYDYSQTRAAAFQVVTSEALSYLALTSLLAAGLGLFFHLAVARRIARIARVAEQFGSGNTHVETGVGGNDEVGAMAQSIDEMMIQKSTADAELEASEERLRAILESATDVVITIDEQGRVESANRATERLFGYTNAELVGKNVKLLMPSPYSDEHDVYLSTYLRTGEAKIIGVGREVVGKRKDGSTFPIDLAVSELHVQGRRVFTGIIRDASDRHRAEELQAGLGRILEQSLNEIFIFAADDLSFLQVNRGARENLGYSMEELRRLTPVDIKPEITAKEFDEIIRPLKTGDKDKLVFETVHARKDGSRYDVEVHLQMDRFQGQPCFVTVILDITERKEAAEKLAQINEELEQRVEERTRELKDAQEQLIRKEKLATLGQLAGGVAHEIRNPMGVIKNAAYFLQQIRSDEDEDAKEALEEISRGLASSERIVSELLDYARGPNVEASLFSLDEALTAALKMVRIPGSVSVERPEPFDARIHADRGQIERLLANLIQNAAQAMPEGGTLTLRCGGVDGCVVTEVSDTGVGIADDELKKVFEPLFTKRAKGIGLGLPLCRRYAELNGGSLSVESKLGEGSTFRVSLPRADNKGA